MQREIQLTADGSHTIALPEWNVTYHSSHGAIGESKHIYMDACLKPLLEKANHQPLHILEMGFGTGLNALLSLQEATHHQTNITYTSYETHPLPHSETNMLNLGKLVGLQEFFFQLHHCEWETDIELNPYFTLHKKADTIANLPLTAVYDSIYFDAFSPLVQPELWTESIFVKLYQSLKPGGNLVTYCSKSIVRKAMTNAGFRVEKIPGPWGKREMVRAWK